MRGATPEPCLSTRAAAEMLLVSLDLVQSRIFNGMEVVGGGVKLIMRREDGGCMGNNICSYKTLKGIGILFGRIEWVARRMRWKMGV